MKHVYLVCSRHKTIERVGSSVEPFTKSEIENELIKFRCNTPYDNLLNVLDCCTSLKKAVGLRNRYNSIDEYRFYQVTHKNGNGSIISVHLSIYDFYIVTRVLI